MSDFFDNLEAQLHTAARARAGRRSRRLHLPSWLRGAGRALPVALGVAVAAAVAVIALVVAGHHGGAGHSALTPSGPTIQQEAGYVRQAAQHARQTGACRTPPVAATSTHHPISPAFLTTLGVLRRPATPADRLPSSLRTVAGDVRGVYAGRVRLARVTDGVSYYIVPAAANAGSPPALTARCVAAMVAALHAELPKIPEPLRAPTLALQHRILTADSRGRQQAAGGVVCLVAVGSKGSGGTCGATVTDISRGGLLGQLHPVSGIVPDGVASVTIRYPAAHGRRAKTVTADVVGNVFAASVAGLGRDRPVPTITWRAADGTIIRTVPPSAARSGNASFCQAANNSGSGVC